MSKGYLKITCVLLSLSATHLVCRSSTMEWMFLPPSNSNVEPITTMWLYLEMGFLTEVLRLNEFIRVGPWSSRISILIGKDSFISLSVSLEENPYEIAVRRSAVYKPGGEALLETEPGRPWSGTCWLQNCEKEISVFPAPPTMVSFFFLLFFFNGGLRYSGSLNN